MEKINKLAQECIEQLLEMSPDQIEETRLEYLEKLSYEEETMDFSRVRQFVNDVSDYALTLIMQKTA